MKCLEFRQLKLSDPYGSNDDANRHRDECEGCLRFEDEIKALDRKVGQALTVAVPESLAAKILLNHSLQRQVLRPRRLYWLGLAASFLIAIAIFLVQGGPALFLEKEIAFHLDYEKDKVQKSLGPVGLEELNQVLSSVGTEAVGVREGTVVFSKVCVLQGRLMAHLVVKQGGQSYTVLVLPVGDESLQFDEGRWHGVVEPKPFGSIAVVGDETTTMEQVQLVAKEFGRSLKLADA